MTVAVGVYPLATDEVATGGTAVMVAYGPIFGGFITNPESANTPIYIDLTGAAASDSVTETTFALYPGQTFPFVPGQITSVSVNAANSGHLFSGVLLQPTPPFPPTPQSGPFPPSGPTTLTKTIPSYLYEQYADDDDLQAFVMAYNGLAQGYVDWFVETPLPVYTSGAISGPLLDWVANGLYGMMRPSLSSGFLKYVGPLNTYTFDFLPYNIRKLTGSSSLTSVTDDIFKRIMTWNYYKGDGNVFNVQWLKRRIMRFLIGTNGTAPNVDQTYIINVTFPSAGNCTIDIEPTTLPLTTVVQECIESGVVQLPFQFTFTCNVIT
jgi:hypothetical protein